MDGVSVERKEGGPSKASWGVSRRVRWRQGGREGEGGWWGGGKGAGVPPKRSWRRPKSGWREAEAMQAIVKREPRRVLLNESSDSMPGMER